MSKPIEELLPEKPEARLRIYAYSIDDDAHAGLLKIGQTTQDVQDPRRAAAQDRAGQELHDPGRRVGRARRRLGVHRPRGASAAASRRASPKVDLEWMHCTPADVQTASPSCGPGSSLTGTHHETFPMRPEQAEAVNKTHAYFHSIWKEDMHAVPRFLWNAKMRFGKTFATYQLAKKLGATKVLVVTFKPAVEDAWQNDLESHVDFDGWQYLSKATGGDPTTAEQEAAAGVLRLVPGPARQGQGRQHQGQERVAARDQLGPRRLRRVPLRRVA